MSTATSSPSQTVVASSVFVDLVGFSKLPTTVQVQAKNIFTHVLRTSLGELGQEHYWIRDLGDGALVICPHSPEHALFLALRVQQEFSASPVPSPQHHLQLRIGLNLGVIQTSQDLEGRPNYLGDGINSTQRVMDFAQPGQILASRAFVDAVGFLHADYAVMFDKPASRQDKHGRTHEVYDVNPLGTALERLKADFASALPHPAGDIPMASSASTGLSKPQAPHQDFSEHALSIVRNWFIPFNALLFSVGLLWAGLQRFGLSASVAEWIGVVLAVGGIALWWLIKHKSPRSGAIGFILAAIGCMVAVTGWLTHASSNTAAGALSVAPARSPTLIELPPTPVPEPQAAKPVVTPDGATPTVTVASEKKKAAATTPLIVKPQNAAEARSAGAVNHARCTALLNKSALGETISAAEKQELLLSCH